MEQFRKDRQLEHPAITRTLRTGYPAPQPQQAACSRCGDAREMLYDYRGGLLCGTCLRLCALEDLEELDAAALADLLNICLYDGKEHA